MPTEKIPLASFEQLPNRIKLFTIHQPTEEGLRHLFRLMEKHLDLSPTPDNVPQLILIDTKGALLPILVTFDEMRLMYSRYHPPRSRVATLIRTNSLLMNAMQLVIAVLRNYQRNTVIGIFDIGQHDDAIAWLLSDAPSPHHFGLQQED